MLEVVLSGKVTDQEGLFTEFSVIIIIEQAVSNESMAELTDFPSQIQLQQNFQTHLILLPPLALKCSKLVMFLCVYMI